LLIFADVFLVDFDMKSELEVVYADIEDQSVKDFLKSFMTDLCVLIL